ELIMLPEYMEVEMISTVNIYDNWYIDKKIGYALSVEHYSVINDRPNTLVPKQENDKVEDIINLYREISDNDS
ncbi:5726_t:CDS:1, partial [Racocetra fulgida]